MSEEMRQRFEEFAEGTDVHQCFFLFSGFEFYK